MASETVREIMTGNPVALPMQAPVSEAARLMRERNIGDVLVTDNGRFCGIVTDRDIVVRAVAEGRNLGQTGVGDICSRETTTLAPGDRADRAVQLMREKAIRRIPVVDGGRPVGIVSMGDLAVTRDPESALGKVSAAQPNR